MAYKKGVIIDYKYLIYRSSFSMTKPRFPQKMETGACFM